MIRGREEAGVDAGAGDPDRKQGIVSGAARGFI